MSVTQCGEGGDLLFLHGYLSCKESFYYQIKYFSKYYKVTAADFPAFGKSAPIDYAWSVSDYADWLEKFMLAIGLKNCAVAAHSFGARVAFKLFSRKPELCSKLVITGGAGIVKPRSKAYIRRVKRYRLCKKLFPRFAERHFGSREYRSLSPVMKQSYKKIVNEDLRQCAAGISCPVLLIYGKDDEVTPVGEEGKIFNAIIKNSRLKVSEGGHFCFSQYPEAFNREMHGFLME